VALAVLAFAAIPRAALAVLPPNADQGLFVTVGEIIDRGGVIGRDTWDNKPPGAYYLYAAVLRFVPDYSDSCTVRSGVLAKGEYQLPCAQIVLSAFDTLYAIALAGVVGWIGMRLFGTLSGALAALLCAAFGGMLQVLNGGGSPDFLALLPSTLAYAMAVRYAETNGVRWLLLAGVCVGGAMLFKQSAAVLAAGIGAWLVVDNAAARQWARGARELAAVAGGAAVVLGAAAVPLAMVGALPDVVDQAILFNLDYVSHPANVNNLLGQVLNQTGRIFFGSQAGLWLAALGGLLLLRERTPMRQASLVTAWALASVASLMLGGAHLLDYYYLALIPAFSVCGGFGLATLWECNRWSGRIWLLATAATLLGASSQFQVRVYGNAWYSRVISTTHSAEEFVAGSIKGGAGSLFVWGNGAQVYALSGRRPAARYLHTLALSYDYAYHTRLERDRAELIGTLETNPPQIVAVDTPSLRRFKTLEFPELEALLAREYRLANTPSNPIFEGWEIYQRLP
jgi:hypothetical protein